MKLHKIFIIGILLSSFLLLCSCADNQAVEEKVDKINQNPMSYIIGNADQLLISSEQQARLKQVFLQRYFSPWTQKETWISTSEIYNAIQKDFTNFLKNPGWGENFQPLTQKFIENLIANVDLKTYPHINQPGIITHSVTARALPTLLPSFGNPHKAGQGFPFDNLENSFISQGTPIRILQKSKDGNWYLISTPSFYGWVTSQDVGFVSPEFMKQWQQTSFLIATRDNIPVFAANHRVIALTRVGVLYPLAGEEKDDAKILMPLLDENGNAQIETFFVEKRFMRNFPLPVTQKNIAFIEENMLGTPYGWGGLYQLRDCSLTTQDTFASFGIWLPRTSEQQGQVEKLIVVKDLSPKEKIKAIEEKGVAFLTLLHFPGHVGLYIGMHNGRAYLIQDIWGLHTKNILGKNGRAIVGKTVITPLDFGKRYINVHETLLDKLISISILKPSSQK
jgi:cell wall-associated NlpC family hydrolase